MRTRFVEFLAFMAGNPLIGSRHATTRKYVFTWIHGQRAAAAEQRQTNLQFVMKNFGANLKRFEYLFALPPATLTKLSPIA